MRNIFKCLLAVLLTAFSSIGAYTQNEIDLAVGYLGKGCGNNNVSVPKDNIHIKTSVWDNDGNAFSGFGEGDVLMVKRSAYTVTGSYYATGLHHCQTKSDTEYDVLYFTAAGYGQTPNKWIFLRRNDPTEHSGKVDNYNHYVPERAMTVNFDDLDKAYFNATGMSLRSLGDEVYISFKYIVHAFVDRECQDGCHFYLQTDATDTKILYFCNPGAISAKTSVTPLISDENGVKTYGLYPTENAATLSGVVLNNEEEPSLYRSGYGRLQWMLTKPDGSEVVKQPTFVNNANILYVGKQGATLRYTDFDASGTLTEGDLYKVSRKDLALYTNVSCSTEPLNFKVVKEARLDGVGGNTLYVCETPKDEYSSWNELTEDDFLVIEGARLNVDNDNLGYSKDIYGIVYKWECKRSDRNQWEELADYANGDDGKYQYNNAKSNPQHYLAAPQDLIIPRMVFESGQSYDFRQVVYLSKFQNRKVYATDNAVVKVSAYRNISSTDFKVNPMGRTCADGQTNEVTLGVTFKPAAGSIYNYADGEPNSRKLDYTYAFNGFSGTEMTDAFAQVFNVSSNEAKTLKASLTVKDGCGAEVELTDELVFEEQPALEPNLVVCSNASYLYDGLDKVVKVSVPEGVTTRISVDESDVNYGISTYLYSDNGTDFVAMNSHGLEVRLGQNAGKTIWLKKKSNSGSRCESEPVKVVITKIGSIGYNTINNDTMYVCQGDYNPTINAPNAEGGYGTGTYSYKWIYSNDNVTYSTMLTADDNVITTSSLGEKAWNMVITQKMYIRRVVTSTSGNGSLCDTSAFMVLMPYTTPKVTLTASADFACYDTPVTLSSSIDGITMGQIAKTQSQGRSVLAGYAYAYRDGGEYIVFSKTNSEAFEYDALIRQDTTYYATVEMCGSTSVSVGVKVKSGSNLEPTMAYGDCKVRGSEVKVSVLNAPITHTYLIEQYGEVLGETTAMLSIPEEGSVNYTVTVSDGKCERTYKEMLEAMQLNPSFKKFDLSVDEVKPSEGDLFCAGIDHTFGNVSGEGNPNANNYTWYVDGKTIANSNSQNLNYNLRGTGYLYTLVRKSNEIQGGYTCQTISDTLIVRTYDNIGGVELDLDKDIICQDDSLLIKLGGITGASGTSYGYTLYDGDQSIAAGTVTAGGKVSETIGFTTTGKHTLYAAVTDNQKCTNTDTYYRSSVTYAVTQATSADFTLTASPSQIEEGSGLTSVEVIASAKSDLSIKSDEFAYAYNTSAGTLKGTGLGGFLVKVSDEDFTNGVLTFQVERTVASTGCKSTNTVTITQSVGFEDHPTIVSDAIASTDQTEECGGQTVTLSLAQLPSYGSKVLRSKDVAYSWYRNGSLVGSDSVCKATAVAGDTATYLCKVSYQYDPVLRPAYTFSNTYRVIGKKGVLLGNLVDETTNAKSKTICLGSSSVIALSVDVDLSIKDTLTWEASTDGSNWEVVPETNLVTEQVGTSLYLKGDKYSATPSTCYFRVRGKSECGTETYSKNLFTLKVDYLPSLPDVALRSSNVIKAVATALHFSPKSEYAGYVYHWGIAEDDLNADSTHGATQAVLEGDFKVGTNTIYVMKTAQSGGHCTSAVHSYSFNLFEELSIGKLFANGTGEIRCQTEDKVNLYVDDIKGGSGDYAVSWEYKVADGDWISFDENTTSLPFKAGFEGVQNGATYQFSLICEGLTETTSFRATISSEGDYKGAGKTTNTYTVRYYDSLKDNGIDLDELFVCYGSRLSRVEGKSPSGGDGVYDYQWYSTTTPENTASWEPVTNASQQSYNQADTMRATTYYKRVVTDGCGTAIESRAKRVEVGDAVTITPEDVSYNKAVIDGEQARMWGVRRSATDESAFIWYDHKWKTLATTEVTVPYVTEHLKASSDQVTYTYYAKKKDPVTGCVSFNSDTLYITAYNNTSGTIFINGTNIDNEDKYWICSNDADVEILSEFNPDNEPDYTWYYREVTYDSDNQETVTDWKYIRKVSGSYVKGENLNLDTCNMGNALKNVTGRRKSVQVKRVATFVIGGEEAGMESNIITIHIVPTLESVNKVYNIVGSISTNRTRYCKGDEGEEVTGFASLGNEPTIYWDNAGSYFGPWLYDSEYQPDGFSTWFEYKTTEETYDTAKVYYYNRQGYATGFMPGEGIQHTMNTTYNVRRAVSDGCTAVYSNSLNLYVTDAVGTIDKVVVYGYELGKVLPMYKGFEIGDSLVVGYQSTDASACLWSLDSLFTDTLEAVKSYVGLKLTEGTALRLMQDAHLYMKRMSNGCWSTALSIPISLGTASNGGFIGNDQKACPSETFAMIGSIVPATGDWIAPVYTPMNWTYTWQYSADSATWVTIAGADSVVLPSELVSKYASLMSGNDSYFRRVATNDSMRVRYSNAVKMSYYDKLEPGTLSMDLTSAGICPGVDYPVVTTTEPKGGRIEENGVSYRWMVSLNGGTYSPIDYIKGIVLNLSFVDTIVQLKREDNTLVSIYCEYSDGADGCGVCSSEPVAFTLYRENNQPNIYQDNDSCDAELITVKVVPETVAKTYYFVTFVATAEALDSVTWESQTSEQTIKRVSNMVVDQYGVYSVDDQTGCRSDYIRFSVDSLPKLHQQPLSAPIVVCYAEDFVVKGGEVGGGNGEKTYMWQYSYDSTEWETLAGRIEPDLTVVNPKMSIYYRRIVTDKCEADTAAPLFIHVRDKIDVTRDVLVFNDYKCEGRMFNIKTAEGVTFTNDDYYTIWNSATGKTEDTKTMLSMTVEGFEGDSIPMKLAHVVVDTTGRACQSEELVVYAHNAVAIDHDRNAISCDNLTPCNGRLVDIIGEYQTNAERLANKWYVGNDKGQWTEQLLKTDKDLRLEVQDTMFIRRVIYNGCVYDTSNTVTVIGSKVETYDYVSELSMTVTSQPDGSVSLRIGGGKDFNEGYYFEGDGTMPTVIGNETELPYTAETYKDSVLQIVAISDHCVSSFLLTPLRGGAISFDGDTILCGGGVIPAIVATDIEGGIGGYTYQWQYKNQFTGDYINIEGATSKEYTPQAVSVETSYRRVTTSGEYVSYSNVITVNIRPLPKVGTIGVVLTDSVLTELGLSRTQHSVEKLPSMSIALKDSVTDIDLVTWQRSIDGVLWEDMDQQESNPANLYVYNVEDTTDIVYYRVLGTSTCGETTSKIFKVVNLYASVILDDELVLTDSICKGGQYVRIAFKKDYSDMYAYSYRTIGYEGTGVFPLASSSSVKTLSPEQCVANAIEALTDTTKTASGAIFTYPTKSFEVEVTRWVKATGVSSTKLVRFFVDDLSLHYSYVVDGVESHVSGEPMETVRLNQGSRVVFAPSIESGLEEPTFTYKWNLIEPLNVDYYNVYGGSVGREGLTSERQEPVCYFYNAGNYKIQLQVSDGLCIASIADTALYISANSVRSYSVSAAFETENDLVQILSEEIYVDVLPTTIDKGFEINTNSKHDETYELYDVQGIKVAQGDYYQHVSVDTQGLAKGVYLLRTQNRTIKLIK